MVPALRRVATFALLALISGCAQIPEGPPAEAEARWAARRILLAELHAWHLVGRVAARSATDSVNGILRWDERPPATTITITGPLGQGGLRLQADAARARLETGSGDAWEAQDATALLQRATGVAVPLDALRYWVRGLPAPAPAPRFTLDAGGRIERLEQDRWSVEYFAYQNFGQGVELPLRLVARGAGVEVRLVVDRWEFKQQTTGNR